MASGWQGHANFGHPHVYNSPHRYQREYWGQYRDRLTSNTEYGKTSPPKPRKVHIMIESTVHWCEYGGFENGHAFSSKDPDKERIVRSKETSKTDQYGSKIIEDEVFYLCGKNGNGLFRGDQETTAKEIPGTVTD